MELPQVAARHSATSDEALATASASEQSGRAAGGRPAWRAVLGGAADALAVAGAVLVARAGLSLWQVDPQPVGVALLERDVELRDRDQFSSPASRSTTLKQSGVNSGLFAGSVSNV